MVKALEIIDLPGQGEIQLCLNKDGQRQTAQPVKFAKPWDQSEFQSQCREIGWYFQDYLENPLGASKDRAEGVEASLRNLGRSLFEVVFRGNDKAQACYETALADGLAEYELVIISSEPLFLGLPWELLNDPGADYVARRFASVVRRRTKEPLPQFTGVLTNEQLNVLLVSPPLSLEQSTPGATPPNPPLTRGGVANLAIETLEVLDSLNVQVELDFLRPATFGALSNHLDSLSGHYHLVHFDGFISSDTGTMVFEPDDAAPDSVTASQVGELLAKAGVPLALLNSGRADDLAFHESWLADAAGLCSGGVPFAVSVPFPLAGPARKLFLQGFYQAIVQGASVPAAVAQARSALMDQPHRPTPSGKAVFWDWFGPAVHQSGTYAPAPIAEEQAPSPGQPGTAQEWRQSDPTGHTTPVPESGPFGLVGRRAELRKLERLFQREPVNLLWGNTGTGKTELALGLASWLQNTRARPGGIFYSSFEVGAGLERVIHEAGTSIAGLTFAGMAANQQRSWLVEYLRDHASLLIWDGVENAAGFPRQDSGLLDHGEQAELGAFLKEVAEGGQSWVLLVSRRDSEPWLSIPHGTLELEGLAQRDALELGNELLERAGVFQAAQGQSLDLRLGPGYLDLLALLQGHPLAMRVAVPLLKDAPASVVVKEINAAVGQLSSGDEEESRPAYLTAVMDYSFSRMPRRSRAHLPFLSLFRHRVMMDVLTHITQERVYRSAMGEELGWGACRTLLRSAQGAGLLESVTPSVYQIHPSLPWFYGRRLHRQVSQANVALLEQEFMRVYADTADYFMETLYENQESGVTAVLAEEGNLTQALGLALEAKQWDSAQLLVQPLAQVYRMQKRHPELRRLRRQLLDTVAPESGGAAEAEATGGIDLWLYLMGTEASEAGELGQLDHAEDLNQKLLAHLTSQPGADTDARTAAAYHQLGLVAHQRWRIDEAEEYFQKSLQILEQGQDPDLAAAAADDHYCLGEIKQRQRRYTEAKGWFSKALEVHQRANDMEDLVKDYRALGLTSQYLLEHDEAVSWYERARSIVEENRDEETAVLIYHELGTVCHARYQFEEAESWYQQALTLSDRLGKDDQMAVEFHHMGLLAQAREFLYEDAENWFSLALEKYELLGDRKRAGDECRHLGVLFHQQKQLDKAEEWYKRAVETFQEAGDLPGTARTYGQLGMVAEERNNLSGALEWVAQTYRLALDHNLPLLPQVKSHLARLRAKFGEDRFTAWWQGFMGADPPDDLEAEG